MAYMLREFDSFEKRLRLFHTHKTRPADTFCDDWQWYFPKTGESLEADAWAGGVSETVPVPGVWEMLDTRKTYRGEAVARKRWDCPQSGPALLRFGGISHTAKIFLDGKLVGQHHNAYTAFDVPIPHLEKGNHEILIHVSNAHGDLSALHIPNDYYNYGGISRPVEIHYLKSHVYMEYVHFHNGLNAEESHSYADVYIRNLSSDDELMDLSLWIGDNQVATHHQYTFSPGRNHIRLQLDLSGLDLQPWSPEKPFLHMLRTVLRDGDTEVDDLIERIGIRRIEVKGQRIHLNGSPIYPLGFNRHEDHHLYGCAIPVQQMQEDLALMKDMHANAVRTSHYPNDPRFLDLCDSLGFLVWEEHHTRGFGDEKPMRHPLFREQCAACNEEMVMQHFNHPSIFVWGILNECASHTAYGRMCYQEQFQQIRALDSSRPVTYASCRHWDDACQNLPDIVSWNIYYRWYEEGDPRKELDALIARMGPLGLSGKPLIISEFGAGALPGYHDPVRRAKWSEERQSDILAELIQAYGNHPAVTGLLIWQFCDVRVDESSAMGRPRTMNNKGVVNEMRVPKLSMQTVKEQFRTIRASKPDCFPNG